MASTASARCRIRQKSAALPPGLNAAAAVVVVTDPTSPGLITRCYHPHRLRPRRTNLSLFAVQADTSFASWGTDRRPGRRHSPWPANATRYRERPPPRREVPPSPDRAR
jgi:hypothetical protein